jgi:Tfp pilus assembly protein PilF
MMPRRLACLLLPALLAACATVPPAPGLMELLDRPGERALFDGMRAYDDGQYDNAEKALRQALDQPLAHPRDRATAHKLLAFVACTSQRMADCEAQFRAARAADPQFVLSRAEAGHPQWGPVYRKLLAPAP